MWLTIALLFLSALYILLVIVYLSMNQSIIILIGIVYQSFNQSFNQLIYPSIHQIDCLFHTEKHIAFLWLNNMLLLAGAILKSISIFIQKKVGNDDQTTCNTWTCRIKITCTCIIEWGSVSDADYTIVPFEIITLHKLQSIFTLKALLNITLLSTAWGRDVWRWSLKTFH